MGTCTGVRYTPYVGAIIFHFGITQPVPVLGIKGIWFGGTSSRWDFTRSADTRPPPDIYVHRWTSSGVNSSPGCRIPKTNNKEAAPSNGGDGRPRQRAPEGP